MAVGMCSCLVVIVNLHVNLNVSLHTVINAALTTVPHAERHTTIHGSLGWRAQS
jgi:hypothetical protein